MADIVDPASRLQKLIALLTPQIALEFQVLIAQMKDDLDLEVISDLLQRGRLEEALAEAVRRAPNLGDIYIKAFVAAAEDTADFLGTSLAALILSFDITNPFVFRVLQENRARVIREFLQGQERATRAAVLDSFQRGLSPAEQARAFRDSLGLTEMQVEAVNNYRRLLVAGDKAVFDRALRDRRFDPTIRRAFDSGTPLTTAQLDRMVDRYRERSLIHRSEVIANSEALRAVFEGNEAMYLQAIESGNLDPNSITQKWKTTLQSNVRRSHRAMHDQVVPFGSEFTSGSGNKSRHPGGFGRAEEDINCHCALETLIAETALVGGLAEGIF